MGSGGDNLTITEVGQMLAGIIQAYMGLADGRVILTNEGFDAPNDSNIYVLVVSDSPLPVSGVNSNKDFATETENMNISTHERFNIEVISRGYGATDRHQEVLLAINSTNGIMTAETNGCAIYRGGEILDLSAIEGVASLRRYRIPVIISNIRSKESSMAVFDKFRGLNSDKIDTE